MDTLNLSPLTLGEGDLDWKDKERNENSIDRQWTPSTEEELLDYGAAYLQMMIMGARLSAETLTHSELAADNITRKAADNTISPIDLAVLPTSRDFSNRCLAKVTAAV